MEEQAFLTPEALRAGHEDLLADLREQRAEMDLVIAVLERLASVRTRPVRDIII
ncbi:MAG: hypothetical protein NTX13_00130 [Acidobacteria bacterium]|nr:hypothetical protein [Acidobacteriota bacterium]